MSAPSDLAYRPCAGIMIVNASGQLFIGQRIDAEVEAWQMPQGGIDPGETAEMAAWRELTEETGIAPDQVRLLAQAPQEYQYDLPQSLIGKVWRGRYRGQRQRWFLFRLLGDDSAIDIATAHPEFRAWRWATPDEAIALAVPFKRQIYADVIAAFAEHLA